MFKILKRKKEKYTPLIASGARVRSIARKQPAPVFIAANLAASFVLDNVDKITARDDVKRILTRINTKETNRAFLYTFFVNILTAGRVPYSTQRHPNGQIFGIVNGGGLLYNSVYFDNIRHLIKAVKDSEQQAQTASAARMVGVFTYDGALLNTAARDQIRESFQELENSGGGLVVPVLERGMDFKAVDISKTYGTASSERARAVDELKAALFLPAGLFSDDPTKQAAAVELFEQTGAPVFLDEFINFTEAALCTIL